MQRSENHKQLEHIIMLDGEIDALRVMVKEKQDEVNRNVEIICEKDKKIAALVESVKSLKVERGAIQVFSAQNMQLLAKLEQCEKDLGAARKECFDTSEELKHYKVIYEEKVRHLAELEISITAVERDLSNKLSAALERNKFLEDENAVIKDRLRILELDYALLRDSSKEQLLRTKEAEYINIFKADDLSIALHRTEDEKETLAQNLKMESFRANMLYERLNTALETLDESQNMLHAVVEKSDESYNIARVQERRMRKENGSLQQKLDNAEAALKVLSARCQELEAYLLDRTSKDSEAFFSSTENSYAALNKSLNAVVRPGETYGDLDRESSFAKLEKSSGPEGRVENALRDINPQYNGKRCLLAKYMR
jgi:hypothetical protein